MEINWQRGIERVYLAGWAVWAFLTVCYWVFTMVMVTIRTGSIPMDPQMSLAQAAQVAAFWLFFAGVLPGIGYLVVKVGTRVALPWIIQGFTEGNSGQRG